jgi:hypothetical protein
VRDCSGADFSDVHDRFDFDSYYFDRNGDGTEAA